MPDDTPHVERPADEFEPSHALHVDFGFLAAQTFGDADLERELLDLFVGESRRLLPQMRNMTSSEQAATAHRLKGSCQSIGARAAADAFRRYEDAAPQRRADLHDDIAAAVRKVEATIRAHLAGR